MRLISVGRLICYIQSQINPYGRPFEGTAYEFGLKLMDYINGMTPSYDVDKVVEELERLRGIERNRPDRCNVDGFGDPEDIYEDGVSQGRFEAYWEAVQIVKGGGVDGD